MDNRFRQPGVVALLVCVLAAACGSEPPAAPAGRDLDPGAFLASFRQDLCLAARTCAGEGEEMALAGCGYAVALPDDATCSRWVGERAVGWAAGLAAGELCFYGPPRGFEGTSPASVCLEELAAAQAGAAECVSGADATTVCEGATAPAALAAEGVINALALPLPCRCVFLPLGEIPEDCQGVLRATDLGAMEEFVGDGTTCGGA